MPPPEAGAAPPPRGGPSPEARVRAALEVLLATVGIELLAEMLLVLALGLGEIRELGAAGLTAVVLGKNLLLPLLVIALFLRLERRETGAIAGDPPASRRPRLPSGLRALGFGRRRPGTEVLLGLGLFPPILVSAAALTAALVHFFPALRTVETNPLLEMIRSPADLLLFLVAGVLGGGLGEETVRAFVLCRFERYLGGMAVGLIVWSAVFGLMHQIQGLDKAVAVGFLGLILGLIYAWRRDPLAPITAHAAFNVAQTLLAYLGNAP